MSKPVKFLLIALTVILILAIALFVLLQTPEQDTNEEVILLSDRLPAEVSEINISHGMSGSNDESSNANADYRASFRDGQYIIGDLPPDSINAEYAAMLFDEVSRIECLSVVDENPSDASIYGLDTPEATAEVLYTDGQSLTLEIGAVEPVSGDRYARQAGNPTIYLIPAWRTIRFTMPIEKYIDFIIVDPPAIPSSLDVVKDVTFSGSRLPVPITVEALRPDDADQMRKASSFGAVSHLVVSPGFHEMDQTKGKEYFDSLTGLLSDGVVAYNCKEEQLSEFGFDDPILRVEFVFQNGADAIPEQIDLRIAEWEDGYIVTKNRDDIVYRIQNEAFLGVTYENLVQRWLLTPFIIDVAAVELTAGAADGSDNETWRYDITGVKNNQLEVSLNGKPLDTEAFRKFYSLLNSAEFDGTATEADDPAFVIGAPLLELRYIYRDTEKPDDVMRIYHWDVRRNLIEINGSAEFTMKDKYVSCVIDAARSLAAGNDFSVDW